jgi:hypothetical protein
MHCHGSQGIIGPDGIIYDWFDDPVGRHTDRYFMRDSGVNQIMHDVCAQRHLRPFSVYCDKGFNDASNVFSAYHGPGEVTALMEHYNWIMSRFRIGLFCVMLLSYCVFHQFIIIQFFAAVEWCFGKLKARNPFLQRYDILKLQQMDVARHVRVAVLLTNAHTCLHESQTGLYFNCFSPKLSEYFA